MNKTELPPEALDEARRILNRAARRIRDERIATIRRLYSEGAEWAEILDSAGGWDRKTCESIILGPSA